MEFIFAFLCGLFCFSKEESKQKSSGFIKIDDTSYIIDNKFVSTDKDNPWLIFQQKQEDLNHYRHYERARLEYDHRVAFGDWLKTRQAIVEHPDFLKCITTDGLAEITDEYNKYLFMCDKLQEFPLTKEEYLVMLKNPVWCREHTGRIFLEKPIGAYMIYHQETAKYAGKDMRKMIQDEFKTKWY